MILEKTFIINEQFIIKSTALSLSLSRKRLATVAKAPLFLGKAVTRVTGGGAWIMSQSGSGVSLCTFGGVKENTSPRADRKTQGRA